MTEEQKTEAFRTICDVVRGHILNHAVDTEIDVWKVIAVAKTTASAIVAGITELNAAVK